MRFFTRSAPPTKVLLAAVLLAAFAGLGWFGASTFAVNGNGSADKYIPHANGCVRFGIVFIKDNCSDSSRLLIASEEKVDATSSYTVQARDTEPAGNDDNYAQVSVSCEPGDRATGGGAQLELGTQPNNDAGDNVALQNSYPTLDDGPGSFAIGWFASARELQNVPGAGGGANWTDWSAANDSATGTSWTLRVFVICTVGSDNLGP